MKGSSALRWLMPAALAALLAIPVQSAGARGMGGGGGHMGGGMGGGHMGGRMGGGHMGGRMGGGHMGGRMGGGHMGGMGGMGGGGRPMMGSRFFSRNGMSSFAQRHDPAFGNRFVNNRFVNNRFANNRFVNNRFANNRLNNRLNNRFANNRLNNRFANNRFVNNRFVNNRFFVRNHFFVGFNFGAFGWWPGWWWGGPWWWGWDGWAYPYPNCGYAGGYGTPCTDPPAQDSRYGSEEYWNDVAMSVQSKLAEQSYYHGAVDGVLSSDTLEAIRQFQTDHGLALSGKIDPKLLDTLGIQYNKQNDQQNEQQSADTNKS